jgi:hypothetical protein
MKEASRRWRNTLVVCGTFFDMGDAFWELNGGCV